MDKIICVGKNYLEHAQEMGDAIPEKPVLFIKPPSVLRRVEKWDDELSVDFPSDKGEVHFECELVFRVKNDFLKVPSASKMADLFDGVTVGLDMTLREHQAVLKKAGHPWTTAKVFSSSAIIGPWVEGQEFASKYNENEKFSFSLNEKIKQEGQQKSMRFNPCELLQYVTGFFPVSKGDLLFTGTPAGVGPWKKGEKSVLTLGSRSFSVLWKT